MYCRACEYRTFLTLVWTKENEKGNNNNDLNYIWKDDVPVLFTMPKKVKKMH